MDATFLVFVVYLESFGTGDVIFKTNKPDNLLQARVNGTWGTICATTTPKNLDRHICERMGYKNNEGHAVNERSTTDKPLYGVKCQNENFDTCVYSTTDMTERCDSYTMAGIVKYLHTRLDCKARMIVRLVNGTSHKGIVEIVEQSFQERHVRSVVCFDDNHKKVAAVVCKQIGYAGSVMANEKVPLQTSTDFKLIHLHCTGSEAEVSSCKMSVNKNGACKVLEIECERERDKKTDFAVRLSDGSKATNVSVSGTVEIKQFGQWGVICDDGWDMNDANIVCQQLFCSNAISAEVDSKFGQGTGLVFWSTMNCSGKEESFEDCPHSDVFGKRGSCESIKAAGVVCSEFKPNTNKTIACDRRKGERTNSTLVVSTSHQSGSESIGDSKSNIGAIIGGVCAFLLLVIARS